ncbi:MAG: ATP-binding protein [Acholeplasmataceae bacterium]|nr:ATP-binding protein [Acholeplasmataceae bacterium]
MYRLIEDKLEKWFDNPNRMPLLITGARQVGKTYTVFKFGKQKFSDIIYINFEENQKFKSFFNHSLDPNKLIPLFEAEFKVTIKEDVLLFFDEIQACPSALTSLKYFNEFRSDISVIASGSLLGVALNNIQVSFPVGKVITYEMHPMNFKEYLIANGRENMIPKIQKSYSDNKKMDSITHEILMTEYYNYLVVGGLPNSVATFINTGSFLESQQIIENVYQNYLNDMNKYTTSVERLKIRKVYQSLIRQLQKENKNFKYSFVESGKHKQYFGSSILWLTSANIAYESKRLNNTNLPLNYNVDDYIFRLYISDTGLFANLSMTPLINLLNPEYRDDLSGLFSENYVACELTSMGIPLFYWLGKRMSEIEFVVELNGNAVPIEVKSGKNVYSRSIEQFIDENPKTKLVIRVASKNFGFEKGIKTIPPYAVFCLAEEVKQYRYQGVQ